MIDVCREGNPTSSSAGLFLVDPKADTILAGTQRIIALEGSDKASERDSISALILIIEIETPERMRGRGEAGAEVGEGDPTISGSREAASSRLSAE